jgi:hypothetical protein
MSDAEITGNSSGTETFGERAGILSRVFGCWHLKMSRPVTTKNTTYRFCPKCGMRRKYDLETFRSKGSFYSPPTDGDLYYV